MPEQQFHISTLTRSLGNGLELVEAPGVPGVSSVGNQAGRAGVGLRTKLAQLFEAGDAEHVRQLHRLCAGREAWMLEVSLTVEPPKRQADWTEPVHLRFDAVAWKEAADLYVAMLPALGLRVLAAKPEQLPGRLTDHARLALVDRAKRLNLKSLADAQQTESVSLREITVTAAVPSPRDLAEERGKDKAPSVLQAVATPLTGGPDSPAKAHAMEETLRQVVEVLVARQPASVLLVGPPGVGKTALVQELARRRVELLGPGRPCWSTSGSRLIAGQTGFGQWQEQCQKLCAEAARTRALVHVGQLTELLELGRHVSNTQSIGSFLRPWIARGELLVIAECTPEQLASLERKEPHVIGAFAQVRVPEPDAATTTRILTAVYRDMTRGAHVVEASLPALDWLHRLHRRYATYSAFPGRAIQFLGGLVHRREPGQTTALTVDEVTTAFARQTGLPEVLLKDELRLDLDAARDWFTRRVVGQDEAVEAVLDLLAAIKARLTRPRLPLASFLFVGPTGTGKTELARSLAEYLFGDARRLARFDLSEFSDSLSVQRLIGGPATGGSEGLLTAKVREQPFTVLLFDEFEKADPAFFDLLLQMLGDGRLTDAAGRVADFCNTVVIMTSNLGAREFQRGSAGFKSADLPEEDAQHHFDEAARRFLRPEIYNRLGAILRFRPLDRTLMRDVTVRHVDLLRQRDGLRLRGVELVLEAGVEEYLASRGHDPRYGARPLKRTLETELMTPLAEALCNVEHNQPVTATLSLKKGRLHLEMRSRPRGEEPAGGRQEIDLVQSVTALRRRLRDIATGTAMGNLETEEPVLALLEKRLARSGWKGADEEAKMQRLAAIRRVQGALNRLTTDVDDLETSLTTAFHLGRGLDKVAAQREREALALRVQQLSKGIFRLIFPQPDQVVLALYSESRAWLLELLEAYLRHAQAHQGTAPEWCYLLPPQSNEGEGARARRVEPKPTEKAPGADPPAGWVGIALALKGDLFHPRFREEAGVHKKTARETQALCLVEVADTSLRDYVPPAGIHRGGAVSEKGLKARRVFNMNELGVNDSALGEASFSRGGLDAVIGRLIEARLIALMDETV